MNRIVVFTGIAICVRCAPDTDDGRVDERVDGVRIVVATESEILSRPADIATAEDGRLYVLDQLLAQVIILSPSGERLGVIGAEGSGPSEFLRPRMFTLAEDTLLVADMGNDRLQVLALGSDFIRTTPLPPGADMGDVTVNQHGSVLVSTLGRDGVLVKRYGTQGDDVGAFGTPPAPASTMFDFRSMKEEILAGTVPALFRNSALPVFAYDGGTWLILNGDGRIERYNAADALQWSVTLDEPELARIWLDVVERNRAAANDPRRLSGLMYVTDAAALGDTLWILLNLRTEPAVLLSLSPSGTVDRRIHFADVVGAQKFAIDEKNETIYFTIPSDAGIVAASWPGESTWP